MSTVFFKINETQTKEIQELMDKEGYSSKAEFFRFLVKFFKYHHQEISEEKKLEENSEKLKNILLVLKKQGKLDDLSDLDGQLLEV